MKALLTTLREYAMLIPTPGIMDIVDILLVAYLFYRIFILIRHTPAARIARSILLILLASWLTKLLKMHALNYVLTFVLELGAFALIIIFQPELRRALERIGAKSLSSIFSGFEQTGESDYVIDQTVKACEEMSEKRIGALICFERTTSLEHYQASGTVIDARVSQMLLCNIFFPKAALHDGALLISGDRAIAAGCVLPLTESNRVSAELGTRHRAGLGMSEATDAVVVIVSEETGTISVAMGGMLKRHLTPETLQKLLEQELQPHDSGAPQGLVAKLRQLVTVGRKQNEKE